MEQAVSSRTDLAILASRATALAALMEIYKTLLAVDRGAYGKRLGCARRVSELTSMMPHDGFANGTVLAVGVSLLKGLLPL